MARLYVVHGADNEFLQDVRVNAIEDQYLITIQNDNNQFLRAHSNEKELYWDYKVDGWLNYFSFDRATNRLKTIFNKYVKYDEKHGFLQYSDHCRSDIEGTVFLYGCIENKSEKEFYSITNKRK
tara:strand:+ start:2592 stop:2963 length:372 start_codon:yes stop_codon:yes gene_type:complete